MASTINAKNTSTGVVITPDSSGQLELQTADTTRMTIDVNGNVGVGTSSPSYKFDVNSGSGAFAARISTTTTNSILLFNDANTTGLGTYIASEGNNLTFGRAGVAERMRIDSSGYVMINSTSATLAGANNHFTIKATDIANTAYGIGIQNLTNNTGGRFINFVNSSNTAIGNINQNASSTVAYSTTSDYRLKENVAPMVGALDTVAALKPVTYNWKADGSDGQGFIAHELQEVVPDCVTGEKDAVDAEGNPVYQGIDTSFLVATLTAAIQELKAIIDTQAERIAVLESKIV